MNFRKTISLITVVLVIIIIFFSREQIVEAWHQLSEVNLWILALLIPSQIIMYFAGGQVYFSYLKAKKQMRKKTSIWKLMRIALEINFVNQIIPSGGVSGLGYLAWRLKDQGITAGQAAMMQVARYAAVAVATAIIMLFASVVLFFIDTPFWIVLFSFGFAVAIMALVVFFFFVISSQKRTAFFGRVLRRAVNTLIRIATFGKSKRSLEKSTVDKFLGDLHDDFTAIMKDKNLLVKPFLWGIIYALCEMVIFWIAFAALGSPVNFAPVAVALGLSSVVGTVVITPGGAGAYEAAMAAYFIATGIEPSVAIAATLITRVIVLFGTIAFGWVSYQHILLTSKHKFIDKKPA
ncbi:flippase-like domain-containing protein [Candidatus Saccharibacteria bacterium]|nr:flippase-like domain-containing protein [Candidatus Saccharibacteria bacterium]